MSSTSIDIIRKQSAQLYEQAKRCFPGGVSSPVRAYKSVFGVPLFIERGDGCFLWDVDGNKFIDFCCSWGPLILGHNAAPVRERVQNALQHGLSFGAPCALEIELAELILRHNPFIEKIRFVSSGTEAVMSAIRLARGYTKRDKILKFEGCYHGHADAILMKSGSGLKTFGESSSAGVPPSYVAETIVVSLNDKLAVENAFEIYGSEIAAIIMEGIPANHGLLIQEKAFIKFLRDISFQHKALFIFDEVITGFRVGLTGAAGYYEIMPDIITYGKIIGGGMPVGAYAASAEIMRYVSPDGPVYQAGTLSGNPIAMAAGIGQLSEVIKPGFYESLLQKTKEFIEPIQHFAKEKKYAFRVHTIASIFWFSFSKQAVIRRAEDVQAAGMEKFKAFHRELLNRGVYLGPSGYEVGFVSLAHSKADLEKAQQAIVASLEAVSPSYKN